MSRPDVLYCPTVLLMLSKELAKSCFGFGNLNATVKISRDLVSSILRGGP